MHAMTAHGSNAFLRMLSLSFASSRHVSAIRQSAAPRKERIGWVEATAG